VLLAHVTVALHRMHVALGSAEDSVNPGAHTVWFLHGADSVQFTTGTQVAFGSSDDSVVPNGHAVMFNGVLQLQFDVVLHRLQLSRGGLGQKEVTLTHVALLNLELSVCPKGQGVVVLAKHDVQFNEGHGGGGGGLVQFTGTHT
jgi:hypothetical protein